VQWLKAHPRFLKNPLYIMGDSYSGIITPILVQEISDGKTTREKRKLKKKKKKKVFCVIFFGNIFLNLLLNLCNL
jgi:carboxypeptidase C (cathepsin A)